MRPVAAEVLSIQRMICTGCGAEANASCNCGVSYIPKAVRAAEAVRANPEKSDRAIAAEIGVSGETVRQARKQLPSDLAVDERTGLDGKTRKVPSAADKIEKNCAARWRRHLKKEDEFIGLGGKVGDGVATLIAEECSGEWHLSFWYSDKTMKELGPFASKDEAEHAEAAIHSGVGADKAEVQVLYFNKLVLDILLLIKGHPAQDFIGTNVPLPLLGDLAYFIRDIVAGRRLADGQMGNACLTHDGQPGAPPADDLQIPEYLKRS
jgi:hypothetical protein